MRRNGVRPARRLLPAGAVLLVLATAGCASMPDSGPVQRAEQGQKSDQTQVQVFGKHPTKDESPGNLMNGFLEATTSDDVAYATAKDYLTPERRRVWRPGAGIIVVDGAPYVSPSQDKKHPDTMEMVVTGKKLASVDANGAYHLEKGGARDVPIKYRLERGKDRQWRIADLPDGLVLTRDDFQRIYRPANLFYYTTYGDGSLRTVSAGRPLGVADRVYLRRRDDPVTAMVSSLLRGPSAWLKPVSTSAFPDGARLDRVTVADDGTYEVRLKGRVLGGSAPGCRLMTAQLVLSVADLTGASDPKVRLSDSSASTCAMDAGGAQRFSAAYAGVHSTDLAEYFLDPGGRVVSLVARGLDAVPVVGPLGSGKTHIRSLGVRHDQALAAAVSTDGKRLYLGSLQKESPLTEIARSGGGRGATGFTAPSWDAWGGLWVVDGTADGSNVYFFPDPTSGTAPLLVQVAQDLGDASITSLRVSSDGVRVAMIVKSKGVSTALVGRVRRGGKPERPTVSIEGLRPLAPDLESVSALSWSGPNQLMVIGQESRSVQQVFAVDADGSRANVPAMAGAVPSGARSVAASELPKTPLSVDGADGTMVRQDESGNWKQVSPKGAAPIYPG